MIISAIIAATSVASSAAGAAAAKQSKNPNKTPSEVPKKEFDWLIVMVIAEAVLIASPFAAFLYCIVKFCFTKEGIPFP